MSVPARQAQLWSVNISASMSNLEHNQPFHPSCRDKTTVSGDSSDTREPAKQPLQGLKLASHEVLEKAQQRGRLKCSKCGGSRMFFCYTCCSLVGVSLQEIPVIKLPVRIDIIKHPNETDGKSTAIHAKILAPNDVTIYTYPVVPEFEKDRMVLNDLRINSAPSCPITLIKNPFKKFLDPDGDPDRLQNVIISSWTQSGHILNISSKSVQNFMSYLRNRQTDRQANAVENITSLVEAVLVFPGPGAVTVQNMVQNLLDRSDSCSRDSVEPCAKRLKSERTEVAAVEPPSETADEGRGSESRAFPLQRVVFIDSTWNQTNKISTDERLQDLLQVELKTRRTCFWRHQKGKPDTYLSTIEAIYYFLRDFHEHCLAQKYNGEYDNLLFFYSYLHSLVNKAKTLAEKQ